MRPELQQLFGPMREGGLLGVDAVPWFNGGLFAQVAVPPLVAEDVAVLREASRLDWSAIDPSIVGTLFERGLDPGQRAQLGAHHTDPATVLRQAEPVAQRPLLAEWTGAKAAIAAAYGWADWTPDLPDDEILRRLLALNRERSGAAGVTVRATP